MRERPAEEESALLGRYRGGVTYGSGFVFVVVFVINLVSRLEGSQASDRWWLFSGRASVLILFGVFSVLCPSRKPESIEILDICSSHDHP